MEKQLVMEKGWFEVLKDEFQKPYMRDLQDFLQKEYNQKKVIFPPREKIFNAFCITPYDKVKVVIVGQDPYHNPHQAMGLSFSVEKEVTIPPSLKNIFKEVEDEFSITLPKKHGSLEGWARQGVLLINATLTVEKNSPKSHYGKGWETFTDSVIRVLASRKDPIVFLLWGKSAQEKCSFIQEPHLKLESPHPSPYSAHQGFLGNGHFLKANAFLEKVGKKPIDWACTD
jgi:uracil-DNA glycosylase